MGKRMGTYRVECELIDAAVAKAAERGETVTNLIIERLQAYIRDDEAPPIAPMPPVAAPTVYTVPDDPEPFDEAPVKPACKHPAGSVVDGQCRECGEDMW